MKNKIETLEKRIDEIRKDYDTLTLLEMQKKYKVSESTILKLFKKYNITKKKDFKPERLGSENKNNQGFIMKVIEYINSKDVTVQFYDEFNTVVHSDWARFKNGTLNNPNFRLGEENISNEGYLMKIIYYNTNHDVIVEFQDDYKAQIHTEYKHFKNGSVRNPFHKSLFGVGILGNVYPCCENGKFTKEYNAWRAMLQRCYDGNLKKKFITYKDCRTIEEWLYYPNFYKWISSQENYFKWKDENWNLDKDILVKGNKLYSSETCCLVPHNVNALFIKQEPRRGKYPIGVSKMPNGSYKAECNNPFEENESPHIIGYYLTKEAAFQSYKKYKENIIKIVAQEEYEKGNIIKKCYDAMMNYEVEITD